MHPSSSPQLTRLREEEPGIFYTDDRLVTADRGTIDFLKQAALRSPTKRARLCAHPSPEAEQHDMLIVSQRETYVAPHRHLEKSETLLVIEGAADVLLFGPTGEPLQSFAIASPESGEPFFYRMPAHIFHSMVINSEFLVFVESTKGPFRRHETERAPWAPLLDDVEAGRKFCIDINNKLKALR